MDEFYRFLGEKAAKRIRLAVMDMWKPFRNSTVQNAPQAAILFDKFHIIRHLGEALDKVRKSEFARLSGAARRQKPQNLKEELRSMRTITPFPAMHEVYPSLKPYRFDRNQYPQLLVFMPFSLISHRAHVV